ncbi:40_t:CDS:2, partial [Ambispora leptoticha]
STPILAHDDIDDTKYQTPEIKKNMTPISTNVRVSAKSNPQIYNITKEGVKNYLLKIFRQIPPSRSLNSKPDYSHRTTASGNLFSGIYKPTMNKQSEVNYRGEEIFYPVYRNQSHGFPIRRTKKPKERTIAEQWLIEPTTYETLPYGYG